MERNSQSTTFSQHEKTHFNIHKLKSWLNNRACVRVFFETHYRKKRVHVSKFFPKRVCLMSLACSGAAERLLPPCHAVPEYRTSIELVTVCGPKTCKRTNNHIVSNQFTFAAFQSKQPKRQAGPSPFLLSLYPLTFPFHRFSDMRT